MNLSVMRSQRKDMGMLGFYKDPTHGDWTAAIMGGEKTGGREYGPKMTLSLVRIIDKKYLGIKKNRF